MLGSGPRTASLEHLRIEKVYGGPHVGTDTFRKVMKTSDPVEIDTQGRARLICALQS